jgi:predicted DNA-binding protein with PD1-like motif
MGQDKSNADAKKRYVKVPAGYLMVLKQGDGVINQLEDFAQSEKILSANFTGMGFVNITFGFFNFQTKKYEPRTFNDVELVSMHGTIAWKNDSVSIHAHGVVADKTFHAYGGHILKAKVGTGSVEVLITTHDKRFERKKDEAIGADVLQLNP